MTRATASISGAPLQRMGGDKEDPERLLESGLQA